MCHGLYLIPGQPPAATSSHPLFMYIYFIDTTLHSFPLCTTTQIHSHSFSDRYKGVILEGCKNTKMEHIVDLLIKCFYQYHGVLSAIISDQGGQFVSHLW